MEIARNLHFIQRGYLNGNHFVYTGEPAVLIDTGYISHLQQTLEIYSGLNLDPARVRLIVNTHTHSDHVGGNKYLQDISGCDIALHRIGRHFIDQRDDWSTWWRYFNQEAEFFQCTTTLKDGDLIDVGPHEFRIIHTPGHAADGVVLYNPKEKILISSDTLWEKDLPALTVRVEGSATVFHLLESLDKIEELDVKAVFPGHGPPFIDFRAALGKARKRIRGYIESPERLGDDLLKRIMVYTVLMNAGLAEDEFRRNMFQAAWFKETVDLYFNGQYKDKYYQIIEGLLKRDILRLINGRIVTTVRA